LQDKRESQITKSTVFVEYLFTTMNAVLFFFVPISIFVIF